MIDEASESSDGWEYQVEILPPVEILVPKFSGTGYFSLIFRDRLF